MHTDPSHSSAYSSFPETHFDELRTARARLVNFYIDHVANPDGGFSWLDEEGLPMPARGSQLWLGARMTHCFSIETMLGNAQAQSVAQHGVTFYTQGAGHDQQHGGWYASVNESDSDPAKELYGQAHILLAASSARLAGIQGAEELFESALETLDRYWRAEDGRAIEAYDKSFTTPSTYRGQNSNMHLTEAYLAAYEAGGGEECLIRAATIAQNIAGMASSSRPGAWRIIEHFDSNWNPLPDYNKDDPRHAFRPYGSQPGHWLEWAKLLGQLHSKGLEGDWLLAAAENLFAGACKDGWLPSGGFCYTVDWDGTPVVREKYWWEVAEAIGAALQLAHVTRDRAYLNEYMRLWRWATENLIDPRTGSWFHELDEQNRAFSNTWQGRPDMYHAYQATLYAFVPYGQGLAEWAASTPDN